MSGTLEHLLPDQIPSARVERLVERGHAEYLGFTIERTHVLIRHSVYALMRDCYYRLR